MKIKKGDTVKIITGKDKGKTGKITRVLKDKEKIVVEGINLRKKHVRPKKQGQKGQIISIAVPFHVSNAMALCASCGKPTRIGSKIAGEKKIRVCKKCGAAF